MKCRHEKQRYLVATVYVPSDMMTPAEIAKGDPVQLVGQRRCEQCGEIVILGPSSDSDPRVQLEMRAAELAALARDGKQIPHDGRRGRGTYIGCAACGWNAGERSIGFLDGKPSTLAGYLARCIATTETSDE